MGFSRIFRPFRVFRVFRGYNGFYIIRLYPCPALYRSPEEKLRPLIDLAVDHMELKEENGFKAIELANRGLLKKRSGLKAPSGEDGGRICKEFNQHIVSGQIYPRYTVSFHFEIQFHGPRLYNKEWDEKCSCKKYSSMLFDLRLRFERDVSSGDGPGENPQRMLIISKPVYGKRRGPSLKITRCVQSVSESWDVKRLRWFKSDHLKPFRDA